MSRSVHKTPATHTELYHRALRGQPPHKPKVAPPKAPSPYLAEGGPYNGRVLALRDGNSLTIITKDGWHGRYRCGLVCRRPIDQVNVGRVEHHFKAKGRASTLHNFNIGSTVWEKLS